MLDANTGTLKFPKSVKLKGDLISSELVPKGLLFTTTKEVNILDPNTGTLVWPSSLESTNVQDDTGNGKLYVYTSKSGIYEVDKQAGTAKVISAAKVNFEGKESPRSLEAVADGIILSSDQNITKIGYDGSVKFLKYYAAPREPSLKRALLAAQAVRAAYIGAAAGAYSAAFSQASTNTTDATSKAVGQGMSEGFADLSTAGFNYSASAMKQFSARYKASQSVNNFMIIMTKQEKKGNQLIQVSKVNGEIMNSIDIKKDKEPEYDVDEIFNQVYYRLSADEIVCYKLN